MTRPLTPHGEGDDDTEQTGENTGTTPTKLRRDGPGATGNNITLFLKKVMYSVRDAEGEGAEERAAEELARRKDIMFIGKGLDDADVCALCSLMRISGPMPTESLVLFENKFGDEGAMTIAEGVRDGYLPSLLTLDADNNFLDDSWLTQSQGWPAVIAMRGNHIADAGFAALCDAFSGTRLQALHVGGNFVGDDGAHAFARAINTGGLASLVTADLLRNRVSTEAARCITAALDSRGRRINLCGHRLGEGSSSPTEAKFSEMNLSDSDLVFIGHSLSSSDHCARITTLLLQQNEFGDEGLAALASSLAVGLPGLTELNLNDNDIGDIQPLAAAMLAGGMRGLTHLKMRENRITDISPLAGVVAAGGLSSLRMLLLGINRIEDAGLVAVACALRERGAAALPSLMVCELQRNRLGGDEGLVALSAALTAGAVRELRELYMFENGLGDAGCAAFESAVANGGAPMLLRHVLV